MIRYLKRIESGAVSFVKAANPKLGLSLEKNLIYGRYLVSGGSAVLVDLLFLAFFTEIFRFHYLVSAVLAFIIAFFVSFYMQKFWTFGDGRTEGVHKQAAVYFLVAVLNLGLNTLLMYFFVDILRVWYIVSQMLASALIAIGSFIIYRRFIFRSSNDENHR